MAMLRFDARRLGLPGPLPGTGVMARALIDAGAAVNGDPGAGAPIDAVDAEFGRHPLRLATQNGRADSVRHLLSRGADPNLCDPEHHLTPLEWCRLGDSPGHRTIEALPRPVTTT